MQFFCSQSAQSNFLKLKKTINSLRPREGKSQLKSPNVLFTGKYREKMTDGRRVYPIIFGEVHARTISNNNHSSLQLAS